jgi:hypothetical protein
VICETVQYAATLCPVLNSLYMQYIESNDHVLKQSPLWNQKLMCQVVANCLRWSSKQMKLQALLSSREVKNA